MCVLRFELISYLPRSWGTSPPSNSGTDAVRGNAAMHGKRGIPTKMVDVGKPSSDCGGANRQSRLWTDKDENVSHSADLPSVTEELLCGWHRLDSPWMLEPPNFSSKP